jgi:thiamine biosynthesis lipoprotein
LSKELWNRTGGAFDITAGPLSKCWGFYQRDGEVPSAKSLQAALEQVGTSNLDLDEDKRTVFFRSPLELNLGAIGKGFALDCGAAKLKDSGLDRFLFHAGHSSLLARGTAPGQEEGGWRVGIRNPLNLDSDIGTLNLRDQAMSISGIVEQGFKARGVRYGHILDPRTGAPAENHVLSAVIAPTAAEADALSTAFFVMSLEEIQSYCRTNPGTGAVIVRMESRDSNAEVHSFGLEDNHLEVLTKHEL